jgi:hypothetical protein
MVEIVQIPFCPEQEMMSIRSDGETARDIPVGFQRLAVELGVGSVLPISDGEPWGLGAGRFKIRSLGGVNGEQGQYAPVDRKVRWTPAPILETKLYSAPVVGEQETCGITPEVGNRR